MVWEQYKEEIQDGILESLYQRLDEAQTQGDSLGYTETDVGQFQEILYNYITRLSRLEEDVDADEIMIYVKKVILELNELNDECAYSLIEVDQQELLCDFIERAAQEAGLETDGNDITEPWREW